MLSINTNLSSLIAQRSMGQATNILNQAIERMTTGYKINHAKDNAANYSIATNMTTKIGAYMVAEDNALQGLDMINTASESLSLIEDKLMRLRALATQASNDTYGTQSKQAINAEANALVDEINRLYSTAEYNGISLYDAAKGAGCDIESLPEAGASGFIKEVQRRDTSSMKKFEEVAIDQALTSGTYSISTPEELAKLATMTNNGLIEENTEFVLANDIDLSGYSNWKPIGSYTNNFYADFDGNGYSISNLTCNNYNYAGLFGCVSGNAIIKNISISGNIIQGSNTGMLIGDILTGNVKVDNCCSSGEITNVINNNGGLIGALRQQAYKSVISNCYSSVNIDGKNSNIGGLIGYCGGQLVNCYSTGNVSGVSTSLNIGGLVGCFSGLAQNCYATGDVEGYSVIGGLMGFAADETEHHATIENCYSLNCVTLLGVSTTVSGDFSRAGGIAGSLKGATISNCTSNSNLTATYTGNNIFLAHFGTAKTSTGTDYKATIKNCLYDGSINTDSKICEGSLIVTNGLYNSTLNLNKPANLQVGISESDSSSINLDLFMSLGGLYSLKLIGIDGKNSTDKIDKLLSVVSEKQTEFGAVQNRLESALDEISIKYENLVSSRSTIRDADIAEVSSTYIQQQILQQASATLLATANQSPSIALQLI